MQRAPLRALPPVKEPIGTVCIMIEVPDDPEWIRDLHSVILGNLGRWMMWKRDEDHWGTRIAARWRKSLATWRKVPCKSPGPEIHIYEDENPMPIRVDCECNVWVLCCDGTTEKQLWTSDQVKALIEGNSGPGADQPAPGGGCATYHMGLSNGGRRLVPTAVSEGDTITISNTIGDTNGSSFAKWFCLSGDQFWAGNCLPYPETDAGALLPAVSVGVLVVYIAGTYYDGRSPITVPMGVSNVQPEFALNYDPTLPISGDITFDVEVCNNAPEDW